MDIKDEIWDDIINNEDPEIIIDLLYQKLNNLMTKNITINSRKHSSKLIKIKPWITLGIIKSIRTKHKIARKLKRNNFILN